MKSGYFTHLQKERSIAGGTTALLLGPIHPRPGPSESGSQSNGARQDLTVGGSAGSAACGSLERSLPARRDPPARSRGLRGVLITLATRTAFPES